MECETAEETKARNEGRAAEFAREAEVKAVEKRMSAWHPDYYASSHLVATAKKVGVDAKTIAEFEFAVIKGWAGRWCKAHFQIEINKAAAK